MKNIIILSIFFFITFISNSQTANEHYINGVKNFEKQEFVDAIQDFSLALKGNPEFQEALFKRGVCYELMEDYKNAIKDFTTILKLDPNNIQALFNRGLAFREIGQYNKAIADFAEVIKSDPKNKLAYYNRALSKLLIDDIESACVDLSKAADLGVERAAEIYKYTCK